MLTPLTPMARTASLLVTLAVAVTARAFIIDVPGDYPTITEALAVAYPGVEIRVAPGTYAEDELILPAGASLVGTGAEPDQVVLDGQHQHRVLTVLGFDSRVENLTITGGEATQGGGLALRGGTPTVRDVEIGDCRANLGGGVFIKSCQPVLERCYVLACAAQTAGGGVYAFNAALVELRDCVLFDNEAGAYGGAWASARGELTLQGCTVLSNRAPTGAEGTAFHGTGVTATTTIAVDNVPDAGFASLESVLVSDLPDRLDTSCSLRWQPEWPGYLAEQLADPARHNLAADPLFCFEPGSLAGYLGLAGDSPALAENNPACGLIGAFGQACDPTAAPETPIARCLLHPAYPNPFNPMTSVRYEIGRSGPVQLVVYGLDGRRVATLVDEVQAAGAHTATWAGLDDRGRSVASGVYLCRLTAEQTSAAVRLTLVK